MDVEKILSLSLSPLPVYSPSTNELVLWILKCLDEAKCGETIHKLEKESGPDFNMKCFEDLVTNGQWEEVETYLSGFTKLEDNGRSRKILYEIRKQKYLEALDRENEALLTYGDFKYARAILLKELKMLIETNPVFEGKLQFPSFQKSTLKTLYSQGLYSEACQHQVPDNPMPDYGTKTSFGPSIAPSSVINPSSAFMRWAHAPFRPSQPAPRGFMYPRPPPVPQQLFSAGPSHYTGFGAPTNAAFTLTHQRTVTDNPARGNEIVRLINLKSGDALLVVTQNANHKLWNWHSNDCNATVKATSGVSPQLTELMMLRSGVHVPSGADYQLPNSMQGGNGKVADIDTEGTFRPVRIVPIAEKFGMDDAAVLDNIIYAHEHQHNLLLGLAAKMAEEPFQLLIVDSTIALFRVDFAGRGELAERQQKLSQMLSSLIKIAEEFNAAVYITNEVISDPAGGVFVSDPKKPAGGHVLAHASTIRLMFRKGKSEQCIKSLPYNNKEIMRLMYSTSGDALLVLTHNANHKSGKWQSNDCNVSGKATSGVSPLLMMLASAVLVSSGADYQVGCTGEASTSSSSSQGQQIVQPSILAEQAKIVMQILLNRSMEEEEVAVTNTLEQHVTHAHARSIPIIEVVVSGDERSYRQATVGLVQLEERMDWFTLALQIYICARRRAGQAVEIPDLFGPQGLRTVSPYHCWPNSSVSYLAMDDSYLIWPRNSWANVVESLKAVYVRGAWRN